MATESCDAIVVAIPARNEAQNVRACLAALASQHDAAHHLRAVILFCNNCTDDTALMAREAADGLPFPLKVIEASISSEESTIGSVRQLACFAAQKFLHRHGHADGIIVNTDADSRVGERWLEELISAFTPQVDAVAGAIDLDLPEVPEFDRIRSIRAKEAEYADALAEMASMLDPQPHDPWPNHIWSWGANFCIRSSVLTRVGGFPDVELAEDRALHAALLRQDARIRHSRKMRVWTSSREKGRTPGGFADLLREYRDDDNALSDFALEPAHLAFRRVLMRRHARDLWTSGAKDRLAHLTERLGCNVRPTSTFGEFWAAVESGSSSLTAARVPVRSLSDETAELLHLMKNASQIASTLLSTDATLSAQHIV